MWAAHGATCPGFMPSGKNSNKRAVLAVIGGSGLERLAGLESSRRMPVRTPFGKPSAAPVTGTIGGRRAVFLARHGEEHVYAPHEINYRANVWALRALEAVNIVSIATVGGIRADLIPGSLAVPDQIIDYTWGRASSFGPRHAGGVMHVDFTHPYCDAMRQRLL